MLENTLNNLLTDLQDAWPDGKFIVYGSAARDSYLEKKFGFTTGHSDIDIITDIQTTQRGFDTMVSGMFTVLDIERVGVDTEKPEYPIPCIHKRAVVTTAEYGKIDFVWVRDPETFGRFKSIKDLAKFWVEDCQNYIVTQHVVFKDYPFADITTSLSSPEFLWAMEKSPLVGNSLKVERALDLGNPPTKEHEEKVRKFVLQFEEIKKSLA